MFMEKKIKTTRVLIRYSTRELSSNFVVLNYRYLDYTKLLKTLYYKLRTKQSEVT